MKNGISDLSRQKYYNALKARTAKVQKLVTYSNFTYSTKAFSNLLS